LRWHRVISPIAQGALTAQYCRGEMKGQELTSDVVSASRHRVRNLLRGVKLFGNRHG
jgi:hypothetical protein